MTDQLIARAPTRTNDTNPRAKPSREKQGFSSGPYIEGLDEQPAPPADATVADYAATYFDPETGETVQRSDIETRASVESLDHLNAAIAALMVEFAPLSNLFRGQGETAHAARKRHRAVIGKRLEVDYNAKNAKPMAQDQVERWAGADEEHVKFCDDLEMKGIRYEQLRACKEALEARRDSRQTELSFVGKEISARVG